MATLSSSHKDDLIIPCWPSGTDCIDWSQDSEVAVAAGEIVQLLIPKLKVVEDASDALWEQIRLRVTAFSPEEVQQQDPIAGRSFSIGEEISSSDVTSVKWSAPGIAKHGRCALAVHTQNLVLSIWAPEAQPRSMKDWQRRLIVNHELQRYFEDIYPKEKQEPGQPKSAHLKELTRVRAFGMSPSLIANETSSELSWLSSLSYIAVSNDNNQVVILKCQRLEGDKGGLDLTPLTHFSVTGEEAPTPTLAWTFEDFMQKTRFVQHLAWGPWITLEDGSLTSFLAAATRSKIFFKRMILTHNNRELNLIVEDFEGSIRMNMSWNVDVLLNWLPDIYEESKVRLLACTSDSIMVFMLDMVNDARVDTQKYRRKEWGQVAGKLILHRADNKLPLIQAIPLLTTKDDFLTTLRLPELTTTDLPNIGLLEAVKYHKVAYDEKYNRHAGHIQTKLWGLAPSPLHDLTVISASFHPAQAPEYIIPADMTSRLIFHHDKESDFLVQAIKRRASTEAIAFSTKWMVKDIREQAEKNTVAWILMDQIDKGMAEVDMLKPDAAFSAWKDLLYDSVALTRLRYEMILSVMSGHESAAEDTEKVIMQDICTTVLQIPSSRYSSTKTTRLMLANLRKVLLNLNIPIEDNAEVEPERCEICGEDVDFDQLRSAECKEGHKFRRCALTFLAIQAPGISKSCGVCGKQYLKTSHLEEKERPIADEDVDMTDAVNGRSMNRAVKKDPPALTEMLSAACDKCIYCGGKFIG